MLTKKEFTAHIETIKEQMEYQEKCHSAFKTILCNDYVSNFENKAIPLAIKLLQEMVYDISEWTSYFIYELNFGAKFKDGMVTIMGENIPLRTISNLYSLITKKQEDSDDYISVKKFIKDYQNSFSVRLSNVMNKIVKTYEGVDIRAINIRDFSKYRSAGKKNWEELQLIINKNLCNK